MLTTFCITFEYIFLYHVYSHDICHILPLYFILFILILCFNLLILFFTFRFKSINIMAYCF